MSTETTAQVEQAQGPDATGADNALPGATAAEQKTLDDYKASEDRVVDLAVDTLDPKDMLRKYAKLGREVLKLANKRKASFKGWEKQDYEKVCSDLETLVKMRVAIRDVRMATYVRVHLWVEAVKPLVAEVEKLSYFQVANKFLPTLDFNPIELTGEIRPAWLTWVRETVAQQLGDEPMSIKDLDASYAGRKAEIERERNAKKDPDKLLEQERKAAEAKARKERKDAQSKIADAIDKALVDSHVSPDDLMQIVDAVAKDHQIALPKIGFDPSTATRDDCKTLAVAMFHAGKLVEMKFLRDQLDMMVKMAENALVETKAS